MKLLQILFGFYINASIHVALAVCALVWITFWELDLSPSWPLVAFVFFGSISGYNFVKYASAAGLHHRSLAESLRVIQVFSLFSLGMLIYSLFQLPASVIYVSAVFGSLTFFYAVPLFSAFRKSVSDPRVRGNLRSLAGLKIFVVAVVWAGVTVLVPWANSDWAATPDLWVILGQRILLVIVWTLPFEIRDLRYDAGQLRTFPQRLGVKKTKALGLFLLLGVLFLEHVKQDSTSTFYLSLILIFFVSAFLLVNSKKEQSRYFSSFWVESIPILWMLLLLVLHGYFDIS